MEPIAALVHSRAIFGSHAYLLRFAPPTRDTGGTYPEELRHDAASPSHRVLA